MKKTFLYLSFFAAAFLVSCKSNEVEETPKVEETVENTVETPEETSTETTPEEPAKEDAPVTSNKTKKPAAKPTLKSETTTTTTTSTGGSTAAGKIKASQNTQEISNSEQGTQQTTTNKASKIKASMENSGQ